MPRLLSLALTVGVLAVVATWLFLDFTPAKDAHLQVWQAFIAWGCHFHCGGKFTGSRNTVLGMSFGAVIGLLAMLGAAQMGALGDFAAPVAVGVGAAVICLASAIPLLAVIPASVYGFAAIAGLALLGTGMTPTTSLLPTIVSVVIGAAFGYVSEAITNALAKD